MAVSDATMTLDNFIKRYPLPHSAKVIEGYQGEYEMEFSTGDVLMIYRAVYPISVTLQLDDPPKGKAGHVTISTVNDDVRFHVVPRSERPRIFRTVMEIIEAWPLMVKSLIGDRSKSGSKSRSGGPLYLKNDQLRLLRTVLEDVNKSVQLECHLLRTRKTILLSEHESGEFMEESDPQSFTIQELIDFPRVIRTLRLDTSGSGKCLSGIPADYTGTLTMRKSDVKLQIARVLETDPSEGITLSDPVLIPIDCSITISPRDDVYGQDIDFHLYAFKDLLEPRSIKFPFVIRIAQVPEISAVLRIHTVHTNDRLVIFNRKSIDGILAHSGNRYFLIPVSHQGRFQATDSNRTLLNLAKLDPGSFPVRVRYVTNDYENLIEDLPTDDVISFDALIKDDSSVVAAKIFDENFGNGFHFSLRTSLGVQKVKWRGKLPQAPTKMSPYADCSEELSMERYNEIMEMPSKTKPRFKGPEPTKKKATGEYLAARDLPDSGKKSQPEAAVSPKPRLIPRKPSFDQKSGPPHRPAPRTPKHEVEFDDVIEYEFAGPPANWSVPSATKHSLGGATTQRGGSKPPPPTAKKTVATGIATRIQNLELSSKSSSSPDSPEAKQSIDFKTRAGQLESDS